MNDRLEEMRNATVDRMLIKADKSYDFLEFVMTTNKSELEAYYETMYEVLKVSNFNNQSVHLGENGAIEFSGAMLLLGYCMAKESGRLGELCFAAVKAAFGGASPLDVSNFIEIAVKTADHFDYSIWSIVFNHLKQSHLGHIKSLEYSAKYTVADSIRYSEFIDELKG